MSENNEKNLIEDKKDDEALKNASEVKELEVESAKETDSKFTKVFFRTIIDEAIVLVTSVIVMFLANFIMQFLGYYIKDIVQMLLILFLILNVLYNSYMQTSKNPGTFGEKIVK